jgi:Protein of unknown function (DUF2934)
MVEEKTMTEMDLLNERIERIRQRAYELWERDGRPPDRADEYWLQAEQDIAASLNGADSVSSESDAASRITKKARTKTS